jgi:hypothetical protein
MQKALLILFGGRSMPNMLTIIRTKPALIVAIVSKDQENKLPQLEDAITELFKEEEYKPKLDTTYVVDAFNVHNVHDKCLSAVKTHPDYEWVFNITAATTIMSIGAYEAARELAIQRTNLSCWYLNTLHTSIVSLIGGRPDKTSEAKLFNISVKQYATVYNCNLASGVLEDQHQYCQDHWMPFGAFLSEHPGYIEILKKYILSHLYGSQGKPSKKGGFKEYSITSPTEETCHLLELASHLGLVDSLEKKGANITWKLSYIQSNFLDGPWLEAYVWSEASKLGLFSDCRWNQRLVDPKKPDDREEKNELDVAMIYNAQLLIAECKTGEDAFYSRTLYKLDSVTAPLGGRFVSKMLVTSQPVPDENDRNKRKTYEDFKSRADDRGIAIVTQEHLKNIGVHLEQQAKSPKHARI